MQTPVWLHFYDIFYAIELCLCLHNAMVTSHTKSIEDPEAEDMYDVTMHNNNAVELIDELQDDVHNNIKTNDNFSHEIKTN